MLEMKVKILQAGATWILQISCPNPTSVKPYFFQKDGFASSNEAKTFLIANVRMFALHMGDV
jgi:hypothetical protein